MHNSPTSKQRPRLPRTNIRTAYRPNRIRTAHFLLLVALTFALCGVFMLNLPQPSADASKHIEAAVESEHSSHVVSPPQKQENALPPYEQDGLTKNDWRLILVNPEHPIDPAYQVPLATTRDGRLIDERCLVDFERMLEDCRAAGLSPFVSSAYRTHEYQKSLYENQVQSLQSQGYTEQEARKQAATAVAAPGTSEHQLGLAFDIVDEHNPGLVDAQAETPTQQWLLQHCWEYGFILRYPPNKSDITKVIFEPWHYRYVGTQAAQTIFEQGLCLEEYVASQ